MGTNDTAPREHIAFLIGAQEFCIDIMAVREIRGWVPVTSMPHAPDFMRGIINLRGTVLPVVDLATRLGLPSSEASGRQVIIVAELENQVTGLLVDAVTEILIVTPAVIRSVPEAGTGGTTAFVKNILAVDTRMILQLSLKNVIQPDAEVAAHLAKIAA